MFEGIVPSEVCDYSTDDCEVQDCGPAEQRGPLEAWDEGSSDDREVEEGAEGEGIGGDGYHVVGLQEAFADDGKDAPAEGGEDDEDRAEEELPGERHRGQVEVGEHDDDHANEGEEDAQDPDPRRRLLEEQDGEEGDEQDVGLGEYRGGRGVGVRDPDVLEDIEEGDAGEPQDDERAPFLPRDPGVRPPHHEDKEHQGGGDEEAGSAQDEGVHLRGRDLHDDEGAAPDEGDEEEDPGDQRLAGHAIFAPGQRRSLILTSRGACIGYRVYRSWVGPVQQHGLY